ncbi:hypothetical protein T4E_8973, partial [Trichinella pseudospiralis]
LSNCLPEARSLSFSLSLSLLFFISYRLKLFCVIRKFVHLWPCRLSFIVSVAMAILLVIVSLYAVVNSSFCTERPKFEKLRKIDILTWSELHEWTGRSSGNMDKICDVVTSKPRNRNRLMNFSLQEQQQQQQQQQQQIPFSVREENKDTKSVLFHQAKSCCLEITTMEKVKCFRLLREDLLDDYCSVNVQFPCCKLYSVQRYACFSQPEIRQQLLIDQEMDFASQSDYDEVRISVQKTKARKHDFQLYSRPVVDFAGGDKFNKTEYFSYAKRKQSSTDSVKLHGIIKSDKSNLNHGKETSTWQEEFSPKHAGHLSDRIINEELCYTSGEPAGVCMAKSCCKAGAAVADLYFKKGKYSNIRCHKTYLTYYLDHIFHINNRYLCKFFYSNCCERQYYKNLNLSTENPPEKKFENTPNNISLIIIDKM